MTSISLLCIANTRIYNQYQWRWKYSHFCFLLLQVVSQGSPFHLLLAHFLLECTQKLRIHRHFVMHGCLWKQVLLQLPAQIHLFFVTCCLPRSNTVFIEGIGDSFMWTKITIDLRFIQPYWNRMYLLKPKNLVTRSPCLLQERPPNVHSHIRK